MARKSGTIVYLDEETKQLLAEIAFHERRSQSSMILKLIRDAAAEMFGTETPAAKAKP